MLVATLSIVALSMRVTADAAEALTRAYVILDESHARLRDDFNGAKGSVRLLFVVDPVCPACLRGLR